VTATAMRMIVTPTRVASGDQRAQHGTQRFGTGATDLQQPRSTLPQRLRASQTASQPVS
jgi:hypothetical protein